MWAVSNGMASSLNRTDKSIPKLKDIIDQADEAKRGYFYASIVDQNINDDVIFAQLFR